MLKKWGGGAEVLTQICMRVLYMFHLNALCIVSICVLFPCNSLDTWSSGLLDLNRAESLNMIHDAQAIQSLLGSVHLDGIEQWTVSKVPTYYNCHPQFRFRLYTEHLCLKLRLCYHHKHHCVAAAAAAAAATTAIVLLPTVPLL